MSFCRQQELDLLLRQHQRTSADNEQLGRRRAELVQENSKLREKLEITLKELTAAHTSIRGLEAAGEQLSEARMLLKSELRGEQERNDKLDSAFRELSK